MHILGQEVPFGGRFATTALSTVHGQPFLPRGGGGRSAKRWICEGLKIALDIF